VPIPGAGEEGEDGNEIAVDCLAGGAGRDRRLGAKTRIVVITRTGVDAFWSVVKKVSTAWRADGVGSVALKAFDMVAMKQLITPPWLAAGRARGLDPRYRRSRRFDRAAVVRHPGDLDDSASRSAGAGALCT
jgi:hypothetical protein